MKTIWKYDLQITSRQTLLMPRGSVPLSVQQQNGRLCLWAVVDPSAPMVGRDIQILGTGNPVRADAVLAFLGTVQMQEGALVLHVFEGGQR